MKKFVRKIVLFFVPLLVLIVSGLLLPATPRARTSLLFADTQKNELLQNTETPRIIFVGGSNLSFGLDSKRVQQELGLNPVNTGLQAGIGLQYLLKNTLRYVEAGDIIVVVPEYSLFYRDYDQTSAVLLRLVFDVDRSGFKLLSYRQIINLLPYMPKYSLSKFNPSEYWSNESEGVYTVDSFNEYGDSIAHWGKDKKNFAPYKKLSGKFNEKVVESLQDFEKALKTRQAELLITYPSFDEVSFDNCSEEIDAVQSALSEAGLRVMGTPERYRMPTKMMFDTAYHLNKDGVDLRTTRLIDDLKSELEE